MANRILQLTAKLGIDGRGFKAGLKEGEVAANRFAGNLKSRIAAAFSVAAVAAYAKVTAAYASKIHDMAQAHRVSTERLQEFDYAAQQNGTSLEKLVDVQKKLAKARADALGDPNGDAAKAFSNFDFDESRLRGLTDASDLMREFSGALKNVAMDMNTVPVILSLIGDRNTEVIPALVAGLKEAGAEAQRLGIVMDANIARQLDEISDKAEVLQKQLTVGLGPALIWVANKFADMIGGARVGAAWLSTFLENFKAGESNNPIKVFGEARQKANAAAAATLIDIGLEQDAIASAQQRKNNLRGLSVDDLVDSTNGKEKSAAVERVLGGSSALQKAFQIKSPNLGGLASAGGYSGGIAAMDPRSFIEQNQLQKLASIDAHLAKLEAAAMRTANSGTGLLGVLTR